MSAYREPGKQDTYVIDERPIVKRVIQLPKLKFPAWMPGAVVFAASPLAGGLVYNYFSSGLCVGGIISCALVGIIGAVHGVVHAEK